jgi:hypothetical protein
MKQKLVTGTRVRGNLLDCVERQTKCKHTDKVFSLPVEGNFYDECGKPLKLAVIEHCMDRHMG